jgi:filamentous hemagglutinin family protein
MKLQLVTIVFTGLFLGGFPNRVSAQVNNAIVPDATLGTETSIVAPAGNINRITGGASRGSNLFHSFQDFSIGTNQTAWFDQPSLVQNILVRVTGNNLSAIDGILRANGNADLFLINPKGITFGQNAKLEIGGAFTAITSPAIPLGEQGVFSAIAPNQSQLLDIKPNAAFDLSRFQPQADIQMNADWSMNGQAITLVGQNITIAGKLNNPANANPARFTVRSSQNILFEQAQINNPSGQDLYSATIAFAPIPVNLQADGGITIKDSNIGVNGGAFQAIALGSIKLDNSRILSQSTFDKPAAGILLQGGNVEILNKSAITVPTTDDLSRSDRRYTPVPLTIRSTASLLINSSRINQPPGDRNLRPASFSNELRETKPRTNLAPLRITLETPQDITIQNSQIAPRGGEFRAIIPGDFVLAGSQLYSDNFMAQDAAPITIQAQNISLDRYNRPRGQASQVGGDIGISSNSIIAGQAATINLSARNNLSIKGTAGIGSNTLTNANTGNIILNAGNIYEMDNGGIGNQSRPNTFLEPNKQITGNNGQIVITAKSIKLNRFGFNMDHFSQGGNGQIVFNAQETIDIGEGGVGTNARGSAIGADILVKAPTVVMRPRSALSTAAEQQSQGGNIRVEANDLQLQGSVSTSTKGIGKAGDIEVVAPKITLDEGLFQRKEITRGTISSYTGTSGGKERATGDSGNIQVTAIGSNAQITLKSGAGIANTIFKDSTGNAGQIIVRSEQLDIQRGSQIIVVTNSNGNAGLIDVQANQLIKLSGGLQLSASSDDRSPSGILSTIQTAAQGGSSEGIKINTDRLEIMDGAGVISSTLGKGNSGKVDITANTAIFSDKNTQGNSSGVLTSVGLGQIPGGELLKVDSGDARFSITTLNPLVITKTDNPLATGNSGNINVNVGNLEILKGAQLVTAIVGQGTAGDVKITADRNIRLVNQAAIRADSGSGQGGSINLSSQRGVLLLRDGSQISAVSRSGGQDGNIDINVPFIVGIRGENSDIFAVAPEALNGGRSLGNNVKITANSILGFDYRPRFTAQNDILATGNVTLNLPDIDPSRGLTVLPIDVIDVAQKIDRSCTPNATLQSSSFISLGSGGLPTNPTNVIAPMNTIARLVPMPQTVDKILPPPTKASLPVEAQSSVRMVNGKIRLQAIATPTHRPTPSGCLAFRSGSPRIGGWGAVRIVKSAPFITN